MKKYVAALVLVLVIFTATATGTAKGGGVTAKINPNKIELTIRSALANVDGRELVLPRQVVMDGKYSLAPMRALLDALGYTVKYIPETKEIIVTRGENTLRFRLESRTVLVNGEEKELPVPARAVRGHAMIPVRFFSEELGAAVSYHRGKITIRPAHPREEQAGTAIKFTPVEGELKPEINVQHPGLIVGTGAELLVDPSDELKDATLLVALRGECRTLGYDIEIKNIEITGQTGTITVSLTDPDGLIVGQMLSYPYDIVKVEADVRGVDFTLVDEDGNELKAGEKTSGEPVFFEPYEGELPEEVLDFKAAGARFFPAPGHEGKVFLVIGRGQCSSTGYGIRLTGLWDEKDKSLRADVEFINPDPDKFYATLIIYPRAVVLVDESYSGWDVDLNIPETLKAGKKIPFVRVDLTPKTRLEKKGSQFGPAEKVLANVPEEFAGKPALVVYRGECPNPGYTVEIAGVEKADGKVIANVVYHNPDPDMMYPQVISCPYDVVILDARMEDLAGLDVEMRLLPLLHGIK